MPGQSCLAHPCLWHHTLLLVLVQPSHPPVAETADAKRPSQHDDTFFIMKRNLLYDTLTWNILEPFELQPSPGVWAGLSASTAWQRPRILVQTWKHSNQFGPNASSACSAKTQHAESNASCPPEWSQSVSIIFCQSKKGELFMNCIWMLGLGCKKAAACSAHTMGQRTALRCTDGSLWPPQKSSSGHKNSDSCL